MGTTYTNLLFHIVFSTKHRKNIITPEIQERLYEYIGGIFREQKGILLQIGGMLDHVHIQNQQEHHKKISFAHEFRQLLVRHGIEFDERYIFEVEHIV